jgi:hypothetical protein
VSWPRCEPRTSRSQVRNVDATSFRECIVVKQVEIHGIEPITPYSLVGGYVTAVRRNILSTFILKIGAICSSEALVVTYESVFIWFVFRSRQQLEAMASNIRLTDELDEFEGI